MRNAKLYLMIFFISAVSGCHASQDLRIGLLQSKPGELIIGQASNEWYCVYRKTAKDQIGLQKKYGDKSAYAELIEKEFFVYNCRSYVSGCFLQAYSADSVPKDIRRLIPEGGIYDECNGSGYDFAGKLISDIEDVHFHLQTPHHIFESDKSVVVKVGEGKSKTTDIVINKIEPNLAEDIKLGKIIDIHVSFSYLTESEEGDIYFWVLQDWRWASPLCKSKIKSKKKKGTGEFGCQITVPDAEEIIVQVSIYSAGVSRTIDHEVEVFKVAKQ